MGSGESRCIRPGSEWFGRVAERVHKLFYRNAAGAAALVNEFMKYGGEGLLNMMVMFHNWIWRAGIGVILFDKGDKANPGNYRGVSYRAP